MLKYWGVLHFRTSDWSKIIIELFPSCRISQNLRVLTLTPFQNSKAPNSSNSGLSIENDLSLLMRGIVIKPVVAVKTAFRAFCPDGDFLQTV